MIRYRKGPAPNELVEAMRTPGANWDKGFHGRAAVREALVRDQRGLCAYCQRRIEAGDDMHIEHWIAQSDMAEGTDAQFRWTNLLGVCRGITSDWTTDERRPVRHCDTSRRNAPLFLHPVEGEGPNPRDHLAYGASGAITARDGDARVTRDIEVLNLAVTVLERGRAEVLDAFRRLAERHGYETAYLRKQLEDYEERAVAPEYFEVIRAYIMKKLRQRAGQR